MRPATLSASAVFTAVCLIGVPRADCRPAGPTTRATTAGTIAPSAKDIAPLDVGAKVPTVTLTGADGKPYGLGALVAKKPTILYFYRGGWCSYCRRQLSGMEGISDAVTEAGYQLLAVSPDRPEELPETTQKMSLTFTLLSDSGASAIRAFGVAFQAAPTLFSRLEQHSGATHHALPVPAIYLVDTDGTIKFAHFDPDLKADLTPSEVLAQANAAFRK